MLKPTNKNRSYLLKHRVQLQVGLSRLSILVCQFDQVTNSLDIQLLRCSQMQITNQAYNQRKCYRVMLQCMIESRIQVLRLSNNRSMTVLKDIFHIRFSHLTHLNLSGNQINNLQALSHLCCPRLKWLSLHSNKVTTISALTAMHTPMLEQLFIWDNNPIVDLHRGSRAIRSGGGRIHSMAVEWDMGNIVIGEDLAHWGKSNQLKWITEIKSKHRINQPKIHTMLAKIYQYIAIIR